MGLGLNHCCGMERERENVTVREIIISIVDDDPGVRKSLARLLSASGYGVETFASAEEFLSATPTSKAVCLVVDFNLGDVSGLELARRLPAAGFELPIIFITGSADDTVRMQCMEFGCVAFLHKPFPEGRLMDAIARAVDSARGQKTQLLSEYHWNAARGRASAAAAKSPEARNAFLAISMGWEALASEIEQPVEAAGAKQQHDRKK